QMNGVDLFVARVQLLATADGYFYQAYVDDRDLHSFPTRRSSDLRSCIASSIAACVLGGVRLISSARMMFAKIGPLMNLNWRCWLDRKSTRLNSSHSQISYAVFCLKKKKTKEI